MGKGNIEYLQESANIISLNKKYFLKNNVSLCIAFRNFPKVPFLLKSHTATESTTQLILKEL